MIPVIEAFSGSYAKARVKFLEAAAAAGLALESHTHPLRGREGEALALDVAREGAADAKKLLIVSSGCHGVEGFCGSGAQVFALHDEQWREKARAAGVAVLYLHALNPFGFSHLRRVNEDNVDLNRNFQDFSKPLPANEGYRELAPLLLPASWPPTIANRAALALFVLRRGRAALKDAVSIGQSEFPGGLFFMGTQPSWSNQTLRKVIQQQAGNAAQIGWIDWHTGLGECGIGERIATGVEHQPDALTRARRWWGEGVTSTHDGSSVSSAVTGVIAEMMPQVCPKAQYTGIALEFGTQPLMKVMTALRAEHWLNNHPEAPREKAERIKQALLDAFYVNTDGWKGQIISQSRQAMFQAVEGLSSA